MTNLRLTSQLQAHSTRSALSRFFALFTERFALELRSVTDAVTGLFFPAEETTLGVVTAARAFSGVADIFVSQAGVTASHAAGEPFLATDGAVLVITLWAAALMASTGGRCVVVSDGAERTITTQNRLLTALSAEGASAAFWNLTTGKAKTDIAALASVDLDAVTVASHHFTGSADRSASTGLGTHGKRADTIGAVCSAFAWVVVVAGRADRCGIQRAGAAITCVRALVIGEAGVDAEVVHAAEAFSASFDRAGAIVEAQLRTDALAAIAKRRAAALTSDTGLAIFRANAVAVLTTRLPGFAGVRLVASDAGAARVRFVTRRTHAAGLVLGTRVVVSGAVVPVA